ncbi:MAG: hypothetical protein CBD10_001345 [Alphaproteobacteria bacterium TMED150]|nr:hypothetical protein [Paracoccaceae bacterium]RPH14499.1 MAG: hypothetical protein CBD10_001345 [Alphaproteobacteria bacterium TMED150]
MNDIVEEKNQDEVAVRDFELDGDVFMAMLSLVEEVTALAGDLGFVSEMELTTPDENDEEDAAFLINFDINDPDLDEPVAFIQADHEGNGSVVFLDAGMPHANYRAVYFALAGLATHFDLGFHVAEIGDDMDDDEELEGEE